MIHVLQVFPLLDRIRSPRRGVYTHHAVPDIAAAATPRDSHHGELHTLCAVAGGLDCYQYRTVGTGWECEWELSAVCS